MSTQTAIEFLERIEIDDELAAQLGAIKDDPDAVLARVRAEGFDVTQTDVRAAVVERYGQELTTEQLDSIAAGLTNDETIGVVLAGVGVGFAVVASASAAA